MRVCGWLLLCAASPLWAAGAFSDVKPDHWAYEAVEELATALHPELAPELARALAAAAP